MCGSAETRFANQPNRFLVLSLGTVLQVGGDRLLSPVAFLLFAALAFVFPLSMGLFVHGMLVGGLTALIALGMALIYRTNRVLNFAQADLGALNESGVSGTGMVTLEDLLEELVGDIRDETDRDERTPP